MKNEGIDNYIINNGDFNSNYETFINNLSNKKYTKNRIQRAIFHLLLNTPNNYSYEKLTESAKNIEGFKFVWITDGIGWRNAKGNLKETFSILEHIYCLEELEQGILKKL